MLQENQQTFKDLKVAWVWRFNYVYARSEDSSFKTQWLGVNGLNTHLGVPKTAHNCTVIIYASKTQGGERENMKRTGLVTFSFPRIK